MRKVLAVTLVLAACTSRASTCSSRGALLDLKAPAARQAAACMNAFGADLHAALPKTGNLFYSPASIAIAVDLMEQGASGRTRTEIDKVLHLPRAPLPLTRLWQTLASSKIPEIAIANRLYLDRSVAIEPSFSKLAPTTSVDFIHHAESARGQINAWVSERTHARIPELVAPNVLDASSRVVVANAVYFKGLWASAFDKKSTYDETFHAPHADAKVPMMHQTLPAAGLGDHAGAQVLELAYRADHGPSLSMIVVLPDEGTPLAAVEASYEKDGLQPFATAATSADEVEVTMPKMKMRTSFNLAAALASMGTTSAFGEQADFSRITRTERVEITDVIHKAYINVNEEGTEAAAASGIFAEKAAPPHSFVADRPFLFFIRDRASGLVLFVGRCVDPRA